MNLDSLILTLITFGPAAGALVLMFLPGRVNLMRWAALIISLAVFILSLHLPFNWNESVAGMQQQYTVNRLWIESPEIRYHLAVDGISLWLVLLTTLLVPFSVLISWRGIQEKAKEFYILMLLLETAMLGVFVAMDLFLFYVFWEATLIPMALMIGVWGHGRRVYAAVKFFLYTMVASVFMLGAIIWLYVKTDTFDFPAIKAAVASGQISGFEQAAPWLFLAFFIAFAVKVPLFPFHTWLPDAHVEAPTAGSVLLAGVLLKMGAYGLLRFNVGLFPEQSLIHAPWINALAIIGIIYGALVALVQPNMKKLVAYSSVSHMGFIILGIFTFTQSGTNGAVFQMLNHGVSTGALFMLLGMIYERTHSYEIRDYSGVATFMPKYATLFVVITLSSIGLPLMNGFVGEFLVLSGAFRNWWLYGALATTGVILSAGYMLWMVQRVFYGPARGFAPLSPGHHHDASYGLPDIGGREQLAMIPLAALALIMGVFSPLWIRPMVPAVATTIAPAIRHVPHAEPGSAPLTGGAGPAEEHSRNTQPAAQVETAGAVAH